MGRTMPATQTVPEMPSACYDAGTTAAAPDAACARRRAGSVTAGSALETRGGVGIPPPGRNPESKKQFDARTRELSDTLSRTLREQFNREIASGKQRLEESLAPYTRFVRIESERVTQVKETLESLREQTRDLRQRIDGGDSATELGERAAPTQPRSRSTK